MDRKFQLARVWSNQELRKIGHLVTGDAINVSGWEDSDKDGGRYRDYFPNCKNYSISNYRGDRGTTGVPGEIFLDLVAELPKELELKYEACFNHTVLEVIFETRKAFANICKMSKDLVITVVPFSRLECDGGSWKDYWRFSPACMRAMYEENGFKVVYEVVSPYKNSALYLFYVGSRHPERWQGKFPDARPVGLAGGWIGESLRERISGWFSRSP